MVTSYQEEKELSFSAEQLYGLVADVAHYPDFLPWCLAARVQKSSDTLMKADLVVGYKAFRETYTSRVELVPPTKISVLLEEGPLTFLKNDWTFKALAPQKCRVSLDLSFEFKSGLAQLLMKAVFEGAARKMMGAFEERARHLFGSEIPLS